MRVVIVNCFDTYEERAELVKEYFQNKNCDVTVIQSDFQHYKKRHIHKSVESKIFIKTAPYYKNLSIARLKSHYYFARDAFSVISRINPDLLYVLIPPNSLAKFAAKYRIANSDCKLIFDLVDLWPETMPIGRMKRLLPFTMWAAVRNKGLRHCDFLITECDLYQSVLAAEIKNINKGTLYLAKKGKTNSSLMEIDSESFNLAYLGSINNIIEIDLIGRIVEFIAQIRPVTVHVIGNGESRDELIDVLGKKGATIIYHGNVYDFQEKQAIFDKCHLGLNVMKTSVCVGLTMKSIDYFQHGLPIINNIPADTEKLVNDYNVGLNIMWPDFNERLAAMVKDSAAVQKMKYQAYTLFDQKFSVRNFDATLDRYLEW